MNLIGILMIGDPNYIGISLSGSIKEVKSKGRNPIQFLQNVYIYKGDRTSHWVGHSKIK